jgi:hypothetical protein
VGPDRCPAAHRQDTHPLGCHRRRIPDRIIFDKLIQVLVFGCGYRRIADQGCSATTLRRRRDEWITAGLADQLRRAVLVADDRMLGLELEHLAVDGCITRRPAAARLPGPARWTAASKGCRRSVAVQAGGIPLAVVPAPANHHRRRAAGGDPGRRGDPHRRDRRSAAGNAHRPPGRRLRLAALPADPGRAGHGGPDRCPMGASTHPGQPPRWVIQRTHAWANQYGKLRWCTQRRRLVVEFWLALASAAIVCGRLVRRAWTYYRWQDRPRRRP